MAQEHEDYEHYMQCQSIHDMPDTERAYCAGWRKGWDHMRQAVADVWCRRGGGFWCVWGNVKFSLSREDYSRLQRLLLLDYVKKEENTDAKEE